MAQNICDNHQYYQTFHRLKLLEEYVKSNTQLIQMQVNEAMLNNLIVFEEMSVNTCDFNLPSVILSGVEAIRHDFAECKYNVKINWQMDKNIVSNKHRDDDIQFLAEYKSTEDETDNEDEKKQEDAQQSCWKWIPLQHVNSLSDHQFNAELEDYFVFDTTYNVRITAKIKNVLLFNIQSDIKTIKMEQQPIVLEIHSAAPHWDNNAPQNLLVEKSGSYYVANAQPACVIFDRKEIDVLHIPTKVTLRGTGAGGMKHFNIWIGNVEQDKWVKCNETQLTLQAHSDDYQSFQLNYIDTIEQIKSNQYTQYKLEMLNNQDGAGSIWLSEFKLFGF
eukprot:993557_1